MLKVVSSLGGGGAGGGPTYLGTWNAATNTPTLASGVGTTNNYYIVSTAGSTNLDGETLWGVGDWVIFNGTTWQKIDGGDTGNFTTINVSSLATLANVNLTNTTAALATFATSSLQLVPEGYITVQIGGVNKKIPYYGV
jgi:hypothetical protein